MMRARLLAVVMSIAAALAATPAGAAATIGEGHGIDDGEVTPAATSAPAPAEAPGAMGGVQPADGAALPPAAEEASGPAAGPAGSPAPFRDPEFGPSYRIEQVVVRGNRKTASALILGELGIRAGDILMASDGRVEAARIHLLSLGFFLDVQLAMRKGSARGGAILVVQVEERGTIVLNALYLGRSRATPLWGGLDVAETNLGGRGISLGGGFVAATRPEVTEATRELGARIRAQVPPLFGTGLTLSGTGLVSSGDEFFRVSGADTDGDPRRFVALAIRRVGAVVGLGRALTQAARFFVDVREEGVVATWPTERTRLLENGTSVPIDFGLRQGFSRVGSITTTLDYDTRSDPLLPRAGVHAALSAEGGLENLGSDYTFAKLVFQGSSYTPVRHGHIVGVHLFAGALFGDAPIFDRFFIGDMNLFLPPRALGLNFSTQPSPSLLGTAIASHRYDRFATRVMFEYAVPLWRRHTLFYSADAFIALGAFAMGSPGGFRDARRSGLAALPIDMTGDLGVRLDTQIGVFTFSISNALGRVPF